MTGCSLFVIIYVNFEKTNGLVSNLKIWVTNDVSLWHAVRLLWSCGSAHHRLLIMAVDTQARQATGQPYHSWYVDMRSRRGAHLRCRCKSGEAAMSPLFSSTSHSVILLNLPSCFHNIQHVSDLIALATNVSHKSTIFIIMVLSA